MPDPVPAVTRDQVRDALWSVLCITQTDAEAAADKVMALLAEAPQPGPGIDWVEQYLTAQKRFEDVCMAVWAKVAEGGSLAEVVDLVGDWMDECIDDESLAAFNEAMLAAQMAAAAGAPQPKVLWEGTPVGLRQQAAEVDSPLRYWLRRCARVAVVALGPPVPETPEGVES